jgi:hypothetical protein
MKVKTTNKGVGIHSLACNTLGVEGRVGAPVWGVGQMTSGSIIHRPIQTKQQVD